MSQNENVLNEIASLNYETHSAIRHLKDDVYNLTYSHHNLMSKLDQIEYSVCELASMVAKLLPKD